ncbi:MAG: hypothetical protein IPK20_22455 [Betaproteobacteria bacterium]|nr:hypothetical protein [Betaproteobacteria bacterium]
MPPEEETVAQVRGTAQIAFAQDALRGIVLLNGGAVIALLAFFGQVWSKDQAQAALVMSFLRTALVLLVLGALSGVVAQGLAYLSQQAFVENRRSLGTNLRRLCITFAVAGMYFFGHGSIAAISDFIRKV